MPAHVLCPSGWPVRGDTELGLVVKNTLDVVEWPGFTLRLPFSELAGRRDE